MDSVRGMLQRELRQSKFLFRPLALGDVFVGSNDAGHLALPVVQGQFVSPEPQQTSVGPALGFVKVELCRSLFHYPLVIGAITICRPAPSKLKITLPIISAGLFKPASVAKARLQPT